MSVFVCHSHHFFFFSFFFFNDTATTEIYTLSLHDALPIYTRPGCRSVGCDRCRPSCRSEEHTSELQSRGHLVCRLLLEKKKTTPIFIIIITKEYKKAHNQSTAHKK